MHPDDDPSILGAWQGSLTPLKAGVFERRWRTSCGRCCASFAGRDAESGAGGEAAEDNSSDALSPRAGGAGKPAGLPPKLENVSMRRGADLLHRAVAEGDADLVRLLVTKGADANALAVWEEVDGLVAPLHIAAIWCAIEMAELLLDAGADVGLLDELKRQPIHYASRDAAMRARLDVMKLLVQRGADPLWKDDAGEQPIHRAAGAAQGDVEAVRWLLSLGASANAQDENGVTPLHHAVRKGSQELVVLLLSHGADLELQGEVEASRTGFTNESTHCSGTALHVAAFSDQLDIAEILLEVGADPKALNAHDQTPLDVALQQGNEEVAKLLFAYGVDRE